MKLTIPMFSTDSSLVRILKSLNILACKAYYSNLNFDLTYEVGPRKNNILKVHEGLVQYIENNLDLTTVKRNLGHTWRSDVAMGIKFHFARIAYYITRAPKDFEGRIEYDQYTRAFPEAIPNYHYQLLRVLNYKVKVYRLETFGRLNLHVKPSPGFISDFTDQQDPDIKAWTDAKFRIPKYQHVFAQLKSIHSEFDFVAPNLTQLGDLPYCIGQTMSIYDSTANKDYRFALDSQNTTRSSLVYNWFLDTRLVLLESELNHVSQLSLYNLLQEDLFSPAHYEESNLFMWGIKWPTIYNIDPGDLPPSVGGSPQLPPNFGGSPKTGTPSGQQTGDEDKGTAKPLGRKGSTEPTKHPDVKTDSAQGPTAPHMPEPGSKFQTGSGTITLMPYSYSYELRDMARLAMPQDLRSHPLEMVPSFPIETDPEQLASHYTPEQRQAIDTEARSMFGAFMSQVGNAGSALLTVASDPRLSTAARNLVHTYDAVSGLANRPTLFSRVRNVASRRLANYAIQQAARRIGITSQ